MKILTTICACFFMLLSVLNFYLAATMSYHGVGFAETDAKFIHGIVWFLMYQWVIREEGTK